MAYKQYHQRMFWEWELNRNVLPWVLVLGGEYLPVFGFGHNAIKGKSGTAFDLLCIDKDGALLAVEVKKGGATLSSVKKLIEDVRKFELAEISYNDLNNVFKDARLPTFLGDKDELGKEAKDKAPTTYLLEVHRQFFNLDQQLESRVVDQSATSLSFLFIAAGPKDTATWDCWWGEVGPANRRLDVLLYDEQKLIETLTPLASIGGQQG